MPEPDTWKPPPLDQWIIYELHVGTFTRKGTFEGVIDKLDYLKDLGINAIELMPVAQFSGDRNWGYDGVFAFAVQNSYGGPYQLAQLITAAHSREIAVILDVVYNHLGPEGNCLADFAPYFTSRYQSNWGQAVNFDQQYSDQVRNYWIQNALFWLDRYHIDALRLDAVHGIFDFSARHFLSQLAQAVKKFSAVSGKPHWLIAESDLNDTRIIRRKEEGGYGLDSQWNDDFHHALHSLLTREKDGYYIDFGQLSHLKKALTCGYVFDGNYSVYRKRKHGNSARGLAGHKFIAFTQNHDQVGNRMRGQRLSALVSFEALKLAAALIIFFPYIPLLFMGEEYGEDNPFLYFTSHKDQQLARAVTQGRKEEFSQFMQEGAPFDPQSMDTFARSILDWSKLDNKKHQVLFSYYRTLISLRKKYPALGCVNQPHIRVTADEKKRVMMIVKKKQGLSFYSIVSFNPNPTNISLDIPSGRYLRVLSSADTAWLGPGPTADKEISPGNDLTLQGNKF
ncbi:MAG: malto-oligosyltrehalose trehalohydrolase [Actinomycetota bacterium]|nr:malto-oligosyltrehalose trehalohydrolase [Actinomycetota bacterium]